VKRHFGLYFRSFIQTGEEDEDEGHASWRASLIATGYFTDRLSQGVLLDLIQLIFL